MLNLLVELEASPAGIQSYRYRSYISDGVL